MTRVAQVRSLAEKEGQIYLRELYAALGATTWAQKNRVRSSVKDMVRAGALVRISDGLYEWCGYTRRPPGAGPQRRGELWNLMRFARQFTLEDLRYRSGSALEYIRKCVLAWKAQGAVSLVGYRRKGQTREAVYRVVENLVSAPPVQVKKRRAT